MASQSQQEQSQMISSTATATAAAAAVPNRIDPSASVTTQQQLVQQLGQQTMSLSAGATASPLTPSTTVTGFQRQATHLPPQLPPMALLTQQQQQQQNFSDMSALAAAAAASAASSSKQGLFATNLSGFHPSIPTPITTTSASAPVGASPVAYIRAPPFGHPQAQVVFPHPPLVPVAGITSFVPTPYGPSKTMQKNNKTTSTDKNTNLVQSLVNKSSIKQTVPVSVQSSTVNVTASKGRKSNNVDGSGGNRGVSNITSTNPTVSLGKQSSASVTDRSDMATRSELNRNRNREHAKATRLRKKAYIQKLKDMANGLRAVQTEEIRQRRFSMQKIMEIQRVRRSVVHTFLHCHSNYERDPAKWNILIEDDFTLKQPITPFRSFRRSEVDKDCRIVRGTEALICEAASISVMVERIGCHNDRWKRIKRIDYLSTIDENLLDKEIYAGRPPESSISSDSSIDSGRGRLTDRSPPNQSQRSTPASTTQSNIGSYNKISSSSGSDGGTSPPNSPDGVLNITSTMLSNEDEPSAKRQKTRSGTDTDKPKQSKLELGTTPAVQSGNLSTAQLRKINSEQIGSFYAINEDDMIMIEDVMMCPFVFRTKNAVLCGALQDCVVPGMLRAKFSSVNKLVSMEFVFDAMGFLQQLDAGNGSDITAQVIPGSVEMALLRCVHEARVVTEAKAPYCILHVNEPWTEMMQYTQVECEGRQLSSLLSGCGANTDSGIHTDKLVHSFESAASGRPACSTNIHYRKNGSSFVNFMCSYPLTNSDDEITHLLHVCLQLPNIVIAKE